MNGRLVWMTLAAALIGAGATMAQEKTDGRQVPQASLGRTTGYVVPTAPNGNPGAQAGMNHTSRSGNTNVGGYVSGNTSGGYEGGAHVQFRFK